MVYFYIWMVVQIVVESLPVSSSGHQLLLERLGTCFSLQNSFVQELFFLLDFSIKKIVDHSLHLVTVVIIGITFFKRQRELFPLFAPTMHRFFSWCAIIVVADLITALFYLLFGFYTVSIPLVLGFVITCVLLLSTISNHTNAHALPRWWHALLLGTAQGISLLPGISRFASTVAVGKWCGYSLYQSVLVSLLIEMPLIGAAGLYALLKLYKQELLGQIFTSAVVVFIFVAGAVSFFVLEWVIRRAQREQWWWFGIYMVLPIVIALFV